LDESSSEELIRAAFIPFGDLVSVNVPVDSNTTKCRGFAFVEYEETDDALAALDNMHHSELLGKVITCTIAKPTNNSSSSQSKPVWEDESYVEQMENQDKEEAIPGSLEKVVESSVTINAPKRVKTVEKQIVLPPGMVRCKSCGGWGKDLVKEHGYCNHCYSKLQK